MSNTPPIIEMEAGFVEDKRPLETAVTGALDRSCFWILCALLVFGPLAFGATEPWSVALLQTAAALLFLLWGARQIASKAALFHGSPLFAPMALFAVTITAQLAMHRAAYQYATVVETLNYVAYAMLLFVATQLFHYGQRLRMLANVLTWFGLAVAAFAILQGLTSTGMLYWVRAPRFSSSIYGPYANRNHYAGLMEMLVPFALALCFGRRNTAGKRLAAAFAALLMSASIILSASRGGASAFLGEMLFLWLLTASLRQKRIISWKAGAFFVALAAFLLWVGVGPVLSRWTYFQGDLQAGRAAIAGDCWRMFVQRPWLGWGLGAFPYIYPEFRSFYTDYFINQAHNDFLQVLVETGVPGAAAMIWFIGTLYKDSMGKLRAASAKGTLDSGSTVRLAALTGCTGLLVHSLVDFNLHIPANAALFFMLCAIACWGPRVGERRAHVKWRGKTF